MRNSLTPLAIASATANLGIAGREPWPESFGERIPVQSIFMRTSIKSFSALALLAALVACRSRAPAAPHQALSPSADALQAAFNADAGKVRIVMLVSPT